jgi:hypothetical protein
VTPLEEVGLETKFRRPDFFYGDSPSRTISEKPAPPISIRFLLASQFDAGKR